MTLPTTFSRSPRALTTLACSFAVLLAPPARATDGSWSSVSSMSAARNVVATAPLASGRALVSGGLNGALTLASAEIYDSGSWTATGSMAQARLGHRMVTLADGRVLALGGSTAVGGAGLSSAELWDPATGLWSAAASMSQTRHVPATARLADGRVLVVGGMKQESGSTGVAPGAEIYDPAANSWTTVTMATSRFAATATLLANGKVLVAGGQTDPSSASSRVATTEIFDPATNSFSAGPSIATARSHHLAALLDTGEVLVAGGFSTSDAKLSSAQLYDPAANTWSTTGSMTSASGGASGFVLASGIVVTVGDDNQSQLYDPVKGTWIATANPATRRANHGSVLLTTDRVLLTGGYSVPCGCVHQSSAELYTPPPWATAPATSFGSQGLGTTGAPVTVTVTNSGAKPLTISATAVTGTNAGDFAKTGDGCAGAVLAVGATCQVALSFSPAALGARSASLSLTDDAPSTPQPIALTGTGVLEPPANIVVPTVPAAAREGHLLTATPGTWTGSPVIVLTTRWQRCDAAGAGCADIAGATGNGYTPVAADVGRRLRVVVTATNPAAPAETTSGPTAIVRALETAPVLLSAPASPSSNPLVTVSWTGEDGASFACSVNGAAFSPCSSPFAPPGLADGPHTVLVSQTNDGVTGPNLSIAWVLDTVPPPAPAFTGGPEGEFEGLEASFGFSAPEAVGTLECRVDGAAFSVCSSPLVVTVAAGPHSVDVRFVDAAGNTGPAAHRDWTAGVAGEPSDAPTVARGVLGSSGGGATVTVDASGDQLAVGCSIDGGSIESCTVDLFVDGGSRGAARTSARTKIGHGRVSFDSRGVRQAPVQVILTARGLAILRRPGKRALVSFAFTVRVFDSARILHAARKAHIAVASRFIVAARRGFAGDSAALDAPTRAYLDVLSRFLRKGVVSVRCEGHADGTGRAAYARRLGLQRARAVCAYLRARGVKAGFAAVSYGDLRPVASEVTAAGRARNRRVEVAVA